MTSLPFEANVLPVTRDHKHVLIAAMMMATLAVMTYFITDCIARTVEARAAGVSHLANALQPK